MTASTQVIEHKTYVATKCIDCHEAVIRVCILHEGCERNAHYESECLAIQRQIKAAQLTLRAFWVGDQA